MFGRTALITSLVFLAVSTAEATTQAPAERKSGTSSLVPARPMDASSGPPSPILMEVTPLPPKSAAVSKLVPPSGVTGIVPVPKPAQRPEFVDEVTLPPTPQPTPEPGPKPAPEVVPETARPAPATETPAIESLPASMPAPQFKNSLPFSPSVPDPEPPQKPNSDLSQVAPPSIPPASAKLPYDAKLGSDAESRSIAAEVAAILSKEQQESAPAPKDAAPRPLIVKLPSERWLSESAARLESLPMESRAAAFQAMVEKYRSMRAAERESMRRR